MFTAKKPSKKASSMEGEDTDDTGSGQAESVYIETASSLDLDFSDAEEGEDHQGPHRKKTALVPTALPYQGWAGLYARHTPIPILEAPENTGYLVPRAYTHHHIQGTGRYLVPLARSHHHGWESLQRTPATPHPHPVTANALQYWVCSTSPPSSRPPLPSPLAHEPAWREGLEDDQQPHARTEPQAVPGAVRQPPGPYPVP